MLDSFCKAHSIWNCARCNPCVTCDHAQRCAPHLQDAARRMGHCYAQKVAVPPEAMSNQCSTPQSDEVALLKHQLEAANKRIEQLQAQRDGYRKSLEEATQKPKPSLEDRVKALERAATALTENAETATDAFKHTRAAIDGLLQRLEPLERGVELLLSSIKDP